MLAHIGHDLRPREDVEQDRQGVLDLGQRLGVGVVCADVQARGRAQTNLEASARRERYVALARLARASSCNFIATAHHADDQLESVLMALIRGAGPRGMRGVAASRPLHAHVTLIRPALGVAREDLQRLCQALGWTWREDATNQDRSRVRALLRADVVPVLKSIRPGVARRSATSARLVGEAYELARAQARDMLSSATPLGNDELCLPRQTLRSARPIVVGELVRLLAARCGRERGGARAVDDVARSIASVDTQPREFAVGRLMVRVGARRVEFVSRDHAARGTLAATREASP